MANRRKRDAEGRLTIRGPSQPMDLAEAVGDLRVANEGLCNVTIFARTDIPNSDLNEWHFVGRWTT